MPEQTILPALMASEPKALLADALVLMQVCGAERVLFVGETITDEYRYVQALSKPPKENVLAVRALNSELWSGGVRAAVRHASGFCVAGVSTQTAVLRKVRYVDEGGRKLFEVQDLDEVEPWDGDIRGFDNVAVTDFGHGFLPAGAPLFAENRWISIACQTNAANAGFNLITKYPVADYIVIDEPEARLATGDRDGPLEWVVRRLAEGRCDRFVVTHGRHGAYALWDGKWYHQPAMSDRVVDTMGAGDAFFAVTACMARRATDPRVLLAIGCAAGAVKVETLGHRAAVTKEAVIDRLRR